MANYRFKKKVSVQTGFMCDCVHILCFHVSSYNCRKQNLSCSILPVILQIWTCGGEVIQHLIGQNNLPMYMIPKGIKEPLLKAMLAKPSLKSKQLPFSLFPFPLCKDPAARSGSADVCVLLLLHRLRPPPVSVQHKDFLHL